MKGSDDKIDLGYGNVFWSFDSMNENAKRDVNEKIRTFVTTHTHEGVNALEQLLHLYERACDDRIEVFQYDFTCFQNADGVHDHNGMMVQSVRYLAFRQKEYKWNGKAVPRAKHFVFRDAHATCPSSFDAEMITACNTAGKNGQGRIFYLPQSIFYKAWWHGTARCGEDTTVRNKVPQPAFASNALWCGRMVE